MLSSVEFEGCESQQGRGYDLDREELWTMRGVSYDVDVSVTGEVLVTIFIQVSCVVFSECHVY